ncbi:MAG: hypothetical protein Q8N99_05225 [Nanoarchaeota archaeon]|nr:hypothetical protein [Nanoarchaeota archaeon]
MTRKIRCIRPLYSGMLSCLKPLGCLCVPHKKILSQTMPFKAWKCLVFLIFIIFSIQNVTSSMLGVGPATVNLLYVPESNLSIQYFVFGAEAGQMLRIYADRDLKEYVTFDKNEMNGTGSFVATINFPKTIDKPGLNFIYIRVEEVLSGGGGGVGTKIGIVVQVVVFAPYPGKYAEISSLLIKNINEKENLSLDLNVASHGNESINAFGNIEIYSDTDNKLIDNISMGYEIIPNQTVGKFYKIYPEKYGPGSYNATAFVLYEKGLLKKDANFGIGTLYVDITNWSMDFNKSKISEFFIDIESKWNNPLLNVYAEINVTNATNEQVDFFKTPSVGLDRWASATLKGFFNAENLEEGRYKANIILYYGKSKTIKQVDLRVLNPDAGLLSAITEHLVLILSIIFILLVVISGVLIYIRHKKNGKKRK